MGNNKMIKTAAAVALGASVVATAVAPGAASAATTYKLKSGKLVNAKTGKAVKGYKVYKSTLYKDGKKAKGFVTSGKVLYKEGKAYTGLRSSKYYKAGKLATGTYKSVYYKTGVKFTGLKSGVYYKAGVKGTGVYKSVYYKAGKKGTALVNGVYYKNGAKGTGSYKGIQYKSGKAVTGVVNDVYYNNGVKATAVVDGVQYVDGDVANEVYKGVLYVAGKAAQGEVEGVLYKDGKKVTGEVEGVLYEDGKAFSGVKDGKVYVDGKLDEEAPAIEVEAAQTVAYGATAPTAASFVKSVTDNSGEKIEATATITFDGKEVSAIDTKVAGEYTINYVAVDKTGNEGKASVKVTVEAAKEAAVESVTAINGTQIEVKFNKAVDTDTVVNASGNLITGVSISSAVAGSTALPGLKGAFSADNKTLTITSTSEITPGAYNLVLANSVKTEAGDILATTKLFSVAKDTVAPTIIGTEKVSTYSVKVNFSEPLLASSLGTWTYVAKDGTTKVATLVASNNNKTLTLSVNPTEVAEGSTITFTGTTVKDTASNLLTPNPAKFDFAIGQKDTVKPTVASLTQVGGKKFEITFDKAVTAGSVTVDGVAANVAPKTKGATADTTFVVTATAPLSGLQTVVVSGFNNIDGVTMDSHSKVYTFTKDTVAPKVTDSKVVSVNGVQYLQLTFDKEVTEGNVTVSGSSVKDYITTALTSTSVVANYPTGDTSKKVLLAPIASFATVDGATYDLTVSTTNVKSDADVVAESAKVSFTKEEVLASNDDAYIAANIAVTSTSDPSKLEVEFSGYVIDGATATNVANYTVNGQAVKAVSLKETTAATPGSPKKYVATITLNPSQITVLGDYNVAISGVKVKNSTEVMKPVSFTKNLNENVAPTLKSATLTSNKSVAASAGTVASLGTVTASNAGSNGTVSGTYTGTTDKNYTVTVKSVDGSGAVDVVTVDGSDINITSGKFALGNGLEITINAGTTTLVANDTFTFTATAEVAAVTAENPTITLKASEALNSSFAAGSFEVYAGTTKLDLAANTPVAISGDTITIQLKDAVTPAQLATLVVKATTAYNVTDVAGNALDFTSINVAQ